MKLVQFVPHAQRDTLSVLQYLTAKTNDGDIVGMAVCYQTREGVDESAVTGRYKTRLAEAANAAMRLFLKILQAQD
jgi:hypothetical protein